MIVRDRQLSLQQDRALHFNIFTVVLFTESTFALICTYTIFIFLHEHRLVEHLLLLQLHRTNSTTATGAGSSLVTRGDSPTAFAIDHEIYHFVRF